MTGMRRFGLQAAALVLVATTATGICLIWLSPSRADLTTLGEGAVPVLLAVCALCGWLWRAGARQPAAAGEQKLDKLADSLAQVVTEQWTRMADEERLLTPAPIPLRWGPPSAALAGPPAAATATHRFRPLPMLAVVQPEDLEGGQIDDLHELYGGLGSGRLVIAGAVGSGKTGTALLLALAALKHRQRVKPEKRPQVPVPVLFNMQGWDPDSQLVQDWLADRLQRAYPLLGARRDRMNVVALLNRGKISVILDGLDGIPEATRPTALRALSQQANFRLVLISRTEEMAKAVIHDLLDSAAVIELQSVGPLSASEYLQRVQLDPPPSSWKTLIDRLCTEPSSPIACALSNPLVLTLVRDIYRHRDDVCELLDFSDSPSLTDAQAEITDYLLDRVLPAAYDPQPGRPPERYGLPTAESALARIAVQMKECGSRDLCWWDIPSWTPGAPRFALGLVVSLSLGLVASVTVSPAFGIPMGIITGLMSVFRRTDGAPPLRLSPMQWKYALRPRLLMKILLASLALGFLAGLAVDILRGLLVGVGIGTIVTVAAVPALGLPSILRQRGTAGHSPLSPLESWRNDRAHCLLYGFGFGVEAAAAAVVATLILPTLGLNLSPRFVIALMLATIAIGTLFGLLLSATWDAILACVQLAIGWGTPINLMGFLEDARNRNVLRMVGPAYQFRHVRLQDRLAAVYLRGNENR